MRYVRFMSSNELEKFKQGEVLKNNTDWSKRALSRSIGFCFFGNNVEPEDRIEYLTGVVCMDRVAVFEPIEGEPLRVSQGRYRDPEKDSLSTYPPKMMLVTEYSITEYSNKTMKLVRAGKVVDAFRRVIEWEDEECFMK